MHVQNTRATRTRGVKPRCHMHPGHVDFRVVCTLALRWARAGGLACPAGLHVPISGGWAEAHSQLPDAEHVLDAAHDRGTAVNKGYLITCICGLHAFAQYAQYVHNMHSNDSTFVNVATAPQMF